ncbi:hypothetical protein AC578_1377 [Pseudocercospora eumusae]|uniref:Uncharacterized protein n=1 Tax=Pseudocercospora eumusae TaxID=321146 RepID=A0A139HUK7_9PEZI|nr:hypothetical protein AC578_1377 [Pseudocercospora eumusae]
MEEKKNLDMTKATVDDEYNEPPPSYEEAVESPYKSRVQPVEDSETLELLIKSTSCRVSQSGSSSRWKPMARTPVPTKPLQLLSPDPKAIKCRCGQHNDTTRTYLDLPQGCVRCTCKYLVNSDGSSHHEPCPTTCPRARCGRLIPRHSGICSCGIRINPDGSTQFDGKALGEEEIKCLCEAVVDTTQSSTVKHCVEKGLTEYEYELPKGSSRCTCGRTVRCDGSSILEHPNSCCRIKGDTSKESQSKNSWLDAKITDFAAALR